MVSLTFFGGIDEIGGNKILIEDKKTRVFLDFGQSFTLLDGFFVDWLAPRDRFGLRDYFALRLMPKTRGLYNEAAVAGTNLQYCEPEFDAVFISHAHADHTAHLRYLDPRIPLYMGECAKSILHSVQETSPTQKFFNEEAKEKKDGTQEEPNDIRAFRTGKEITVGSMKVTPVHVDHSVPGAYGFLVETSEGAIAYTGDFRMHGNKPQLTGDFIREAKAFEPEALIIEGTRVGGDGRRKNHTEEFVRQESGKVIAGAKGPALAMRYPKDIDRFMSFYRIAKQTGRALVISMKTAHLLNSLADDESLGLPKPEKDKNIEIYAREMKTYKKWEKDMLEKCVDSKWAKENQKGIIWELEFASLAELVDVEPKSGVCIHSMSEPFEEDPLSQLQDNVLQNWLAEFGMPYHQLHASGHASGEEVFQIIKEIAPKRLFPVHTHGSGDFPKHVKVQKGKKIEI
jgi:ribonuclease J